jgi:NTE family protein
VLKKQGFLLVFLSLACLWAAAQERSTERPRVALVLGGGGAKGFAHIAVLELIEELGIPVDMIAGVSSGAIVGGLYCAGYSPAMIKEALTDLDWPSLFQDRPVSPFEDELGGGDMQLRIRLDGGPAPDWEKGYSSGEQVYLLFKRLTIKLPSYIDFDDLPVPFRAAAVELPQGGVELIGQGDLAEAIRASMGIPGVFEPVEIDGRGFVDGGLLNNLPIREIREMGFDIVIGVELFPQPQNIDTKLMKIPDLMLTLYSSRMSRDQHPLADLVLMPDVSRFSIMEFGKGDEIYALAPEERERLREALLPIQARTGSSSRPAAAYGERAPLVIQKITIRGDTSHRAYIEKEFEKRIKGRALEGDALSSFVNRVYETGAYRFVSTRTDARGSETSLELTLYPAESSKILFLAALGYYGAFSPEFTVSRVSLGSALELRGLSGAGSVLRLSSSIMDSLSFGISWLKPLGPRAFIMGEAEIAREQDVVVLGLLNDEGRVNQDLSGRGALTWGIYFDRHNRLALSPEFVWIKADETPDRAPGFALSYTFNSLDYSFFPTRGFYGELKSTLWAPLPAEDSPVDMVSADILAALPLGRRFSLAARVFAGSRIDFRDAALPSDIPFLSFTDFDRRFFPHVSGRERYGAHKAAASLSLQFEPWKALTLLGGQMLFSLSAAAGELMASDWEDFRPGALVWCASLGAGLRLGKKTGVSLRAGAGGEKLRRAAPFVSFDLGTMSY